MGSMNYRCRLQALVPLFYTQCLLMKATDFLQLPRDPVGLWLPENKFEEPMLMSDLEKAFFSPHALYRLDVKP